MIGGMRTISFRLRSGPSWLITFADLIALLLTFFVMMYATQRVETGDWKALIQSLSQSLNPARTVIVPRPSADENIFLLSPKRMLDLSYLEILIKGRREFQPVLDQLSFRRFDDRLVISLSSDLAFPPGSAVPRARTREMIFTLAATLRHVGNRIDVFGHSDPRPLSGGRFASNWELSLARAAAVVALLREAGYESDVAAFGLGASRFAELSMVPPGRRDALARRVDIVIRPGRSVR